MRTREDLYHGEKKIESSLSHLAIDLHVSPSTQNQAMNALVFLYKKVPVVLTPDETRRVISLMSGVHQLVVKLLYGSGLRIIECLRLRVQDIDFAIKTLTIRSAKGGKDRITTFPATLIDPLQEQASQTRQNNSRTGPKSRLWRGLHATCSRPEVS